MRAASLFGLCSAIFLAACGGKEDAVSNEPFVPVPAKAEASCQQFGRQMVAALADDDLDAFRQFLPDEEASKRYFNVATPAKAELRGWETPTAEDIAKEIEKDMAMRQRVFADAFSRVNDLPEFDWATSEISYVDTQHQGDKYAPHVAMVRIVARITSGDKRLKMVLKCRTEAAEDTVLTVMID